VSQQQGKGIDRPTQQDYVHNETSKGGSKDFLRKQKEKENWD
jgi:hypothetical protein